jgi:hypothetical protein
MEITAAAGATTALEVTAAAQTGVVDLQQRPAAKFFSARELAILDEIAELIIPADAQSGGARAAGCASFIDSQLAESIDPLWRQSWRDDIAEIDETAVAMLGRPLLELSAAQRQALMQRISRNEKNPQENLDYSFATIKWWVAEAYYTSRIGIHDELRYRGNSFLDEFVGTDVSTALHKPDK